MKEGYWGNYQARSTFLIDEHEQWIRRGGNAERLQIPRCVMDTFDRFVPQRDRDLFLLYLFHQAPIIRIRGHGSYVTFEYAVDNEEDTLSYIEHWCKENAGSHTGLRIVNFVTRTDATIQWRDFQRVMSEDGTEAAMNCAEVAEIRLQPKVVRALEANLQCIGWTA